MKNTEEKIALNTRLYRADVEQILQISQRLRLEKSEIVRRAIREGLKTFDGVNLPGGEPREAEGR